MKPTTTTIIKCWWKSRSKTFSTLCNESVTHGEVVLMHLYLVAVVIACCIAGVIEGGAL